MEKTNFKEKLKKLKKIKLGIYFGIMMGFVIIATTSIFAIGALWSFNETGNEYEAKIGALRNSMIRMVIQTLPYLEESRRKELLDSYGNKENRDENIRICVRSKDKLDNLDDCEIKNTDPRYESKQYISSIDKNQNSIIFSWLVKRPNSYGVDGMSSAWNLIGKFFLYIILLGFIASFMMSSKITKPLEKISNAAKQIASGNFDVKIEESNFTEINDMIYSYNEMGQQLNELYNSLETKVQERTVALEEANEKLKETQAMMVHSEKMRSLGELVAGIAHEINNPVNFIHGNIMILQNYAEDLIRLIDAFGEYEDEIKPEDKEKIEKIKKEIDLEFLRDDIKDLIKSCVEGTQRTKNIVLDLKNFSRMEEMVLTQFDIPKEIDTTLNILNNKYKNRITVIKNYAENLPKIEAYGGQLNQVFMNILDNAQDAIKDTGTLTINVDTDKSGENVKIEFIDTGAGIPEENLKKVFDPFFTTKAVGKGTGLGMSISYRVIKDHNGTINVESKVGKGTKFTIVLPVNHVSAEKEEEKKTV